jgi:hypothetical protein
MEGAYRGLTDQPLESEDEHNYRAKPGEAVAFVKNDLEHRYCVELIVNGEFDGEQLKSYLADIGSSIALVRNDTQLKLHIHTDEPEIVLSLFAGKGEIVRRKVDDMKDQVSAFAGLAPHAETASVLAVVPGEGFRRIFSDLGAKQTIVYGEQLPSAGEIMRVLARFDNEHIIVLPNDGNNIPAAKLAAEQSKSNVVIVPSRDIVQGISAICAFLDDETLEENVRNMTESLADGTQIKVYAVLRDSQFGSVALHPGDYFAVSGDEVLSSGADPLKVVVAALEKVDISARGGVTVFYGPAENEPFAAKLAAGLRERYSMLEIEHIYGGQSGALFIVAVE